MNVFHGQNSFLLLAEILQDSKTNSLYIELPWYILILIVNV